MAIVTEFPYLGDTVQGWDLIVVDFFVRITCSLPIWPF